MISATSEQLVSRSTSVTTHAALGNTSFHSEKARFVLTSVDRLRCRVATTSYSKSRHDRASELDSWDCLDELVAEEDYSQEWGEAAPR